MTGPGRSARGEMVDFQMMAIKTQLAANPIPISVRNRKAAIEQTVIPVDPVETDEVETSEADVPAVKQKTQRASQLQNK